MKTLKNVFAFALAAALVLSLNLTAFADSLPIGIPDDGTNLSRGIKLLETAGLITVDPEAGYTPEIADITGYLYDVEVTPVQANTLPSTLADFGASTINGTYAIPFGLIPSRDGLIIDYLTRYDAGTEAGALATLEEVMPARAAALMPSVPWAWAAVWTPYIRAISQMAFSSSWVSCGEPTVVPRLMTPPVAMTLMKSAPQSARKRNPSASTTLPAPTLTVSP